MKKLFTLAAILLAFGTAKAQKVLIKNGFPEFDLII